MVLNSLSPIYNLHSHLAPIYTPPPQALSSDIYMAVEYGSSFQEPFGSWVEIR